MKMIEILEIVANNTHYNNISIDTLIESQPRQIKNAFANNELFLLKEYLSQQKRYADKDSVFCIKNEC